MTRIVTAVNRNHWQIVVAAVVVDAEYSAALCLEVLPLVVVVAAAVVA